MLILAGSGDLGDSSKDFAAVVAYMVGIEPPEVPEEEMVDYDLSLEHADVNVVYLSSDYYLIDHDQEEPPAAELVFAVEDAVFKKPSVHVNHLRPLHLKGHINGVPVHSMLVDNGAIVNVMPYWLYKKLGNKDEELVKTNMTITGVGGDAPIPARGIANIELTIGSNTLATTFFVADIKGSYNVILGLDWIHANECVPSSLHQYLIQWVGDAIEIIHADSSTEVATADASELGGDSAFACLLGRDLLDYDFVSYTRHGFVPVLLKSIDNRLNTIM